MFIANKGLKCQTRKNCLTTVPYAAKKWRKGTLDAWDSGAGDGSSRKNLGLWVGALKHADVEAVR